MGESNTARTEGKDNVDNASTAPTTSASDVLAAAEEARKKNEQRDAERKKKRAADRVLVAAAKKGDHKAFRTLVEQNQGRLFAVAFGMLKDRDDAADAVQDSFIKAHRKLPDFEEKAAFSTWLYRICVNRCIDKQRSKKRRPKVNLDDVRPTELTEDGLYAGAQITPKLRGQNPLRNLSERQLGDQLRRAMDELSEDHRSVVLLREVEGMSYEEIAETLGVPKGTIMSRLFHARKNLQRILRPILGIDEDSELSSQGPLS